MLSNEILTSDWGIRSWSMRPEVSFRFLASLIALGAVGVVLWLEIPFARRELSAGDVHYRSKLVAAMGSSRPAGRLRGFPFYSESVATPMGSSERRALTQREENVERELRALPSPGARAELALIALAAGKTEKAVNLLEAAVAVDSPEKPRFLNDLSVAYIARGEAVDRPRDFIQALDVATQAAEIDSSLSEACFNRAVALERLQLIYIAKTTWEDCARHEPDLRWKGEITKHLAALQPSAKPINFELALRAGDETALEKVIASDLQSARTEGLEKILPDWGTAFLSGRQEEASATAARGLALGRILTRVDRDSTVAEVFEEIARETNRPAGSTRLTALAQAARLYRDARSEFRAYRVDVSQRLFEKARALFAQAGSPLKAWAELGAIGGDFYRDDFDTVLERLRIIHSEVDAARFPALAAQWHWMKGMTFSRQGNLHASLQEFKATVVDFERTAERENLGAGYQLVGETYRLLGDEDEAWHHRMRGLVLLRDNQTSRRRLLLLRDASESLLAEGLGRAALAFQDEAVQVAPRSADGRDLAELLLWRSRALVQLGRFENAWADLEEARSQTARIEDPRLQERSLADIGFAEADLESLSNPQRALPLFNESAATYRRKGHVLPLATLLLHRARLARTLRLPDRELADLTEGIDLVERQWQSLDAEKDRVSFLEISQGLYDARVEFEIERSNLSSALEFSERARAFWTGSPGSINASWVHSLAVAPRGGGLCPVGAQEVLPPNTVVLEYAITGDRVFLWLLRCGGIRFVALPVTADRLDEITRTFRRAAQGTPPAPKHLEEIAERAYDLLFRRIANDIPVGARIVVVPDKILYGIPFAALRERASGRFLVEDHEIVLTPSATFFKAALYRPDTNLDQDDDVLLVSPLDSDLKESGAEIKDLLRLYPGAHVLTGPAARKTAVLQELGKHRVLHYAGHAIVHTSDPFHSWLPLASSMDGPEAITVKDLQGRRFERLDLVVLSACGSVAAAPTRTGGFLGLARPLLGGGARSVVGTLWDIDDTISRDVLVSFHRELRSGRSPAAALRAAQLRYLQQNKDSSAWAAFAVMGEGASQEQKPNSN